MLRRVITVAVVTTALAACGGSSKNNATPSEPKPVLTAVLTSAVQKTTDEQSAHVEMNMTFEGIGQAGSAKLSGDIDMGSGDAAMTLSGTGDAVKDLTETVSMRIVDKTVYVQIPASMRDTLGVDTPWAKATAEQFGFDNSNPLAGFMNVTDPTQALTFLKSIPGGVTNLGDEQHDGVQTTHYHADLDLTQMAKNKGDGKDSQLAAGMLALFGLGNLELPLDVWVDSDGRVRDVTLTWDLSGMMSGFGAMFGSSTSTPTTAPQKAEVKIALQFSEFGTPVHVEAPPANEVSELPKNKVLFGGDSESTSSDSSTGSGDSCMNDATGIVRTAIDAYRAKTGNSAATPSLVDLVKAGLLQDVNGVKLQYAGTMPAISSFC